MTRVALIMVLLAWAQSSQAQEIYYLFSFSVPHQSLVQAASQAEKTGAVMVLRGLVEDNWSITLRKVLAILRDSKSSPQVAIDPTLFERFKVQRVPAVVGVCDDGTVRKVYGNIPIPEALRIIEGSGQCWKR